MEEPPIRPDVKIDYNQILINGQFLDSASGQAFIALQLQHPVFGFSNLILGFSDILALANCPIAMFLILLGLTVVVVGFREDFSNI